MESIHKISYNERGSVQKHPPECYNEGNYHLKHKNLYNNSKSPYLDASNCDTAYEDTDDVDALQLQQVIEKAKKFANKENNNC